MLNRSIFIEPTPEAFHDAMRDHLETKHLDIAAAYNETGAIIATINDNHEHLTYPQTQNLNQLEHLYTHATNILTDLHDALTTTIESITGPQPGTHTKHPEPPQALMGSLLGQTVYLSSPKGDALTGQVTTLTVDNPGRDADTQPDDDPNQYLILQVPVLGDPQ